MNKLNKAIDTISYITKLNNRKHWMNKLHPLFKLSLTVIYILFVISIEKYDILRIIPYILYPILMFSILNISFKSAFKQTYLIILLVIFVGIFNPLFDRSLIIIDNLKVNAGYISFLTLAIKGIITVLASYILIASTSIDDICCALKCLHLPNIIIMIMNLIMRYLTVLLLELDELSNAYYMRSYTPGIQFKDWGSFIGLLILRSIDRSKIVYESMNLRGFNINNMYLHKKYPKSFTNYIFVSCWLIYFILCKYTYLILLIGGIF